MLIALTARQGVLPESDSMAMPLDSGTIERVRIGRR